MNRKLAMVNESSSDFESWNVDDESNKLTKINIPLETKEFINILQINKGYVHQEDNEFMNVLDSFSKLDLDELRDAVIVEISDEDKSDRSNSWDNEEFNEVMFVSIFQQPQERVRRSQLYSDLFKSNLCDKHWKGTPSVEILSKIMIPKAGTSYP